VASASPLVSVYRVGRVDAGDGELARRGLREDPAGARSRVRSDRWVAGQSSVRIGVGFGVIGRPTPLSYQAGAPGPGSIYGRNVESGVTAG